VLWLNTKHLDSQQLKLVMPSRDVIIVGAGVIGSAVADRLSRALPLRITVVDRGGAGCEASNAAAGVLAVSSSAARRGALLALRRISAGMFPAWVDLLRAETGCNLGFRRDGILALAFSETEAVLLGELVRDRIGQGWRCQALTPSEVRALEPAVSPAVCAGALFPEDGAIDNEQLTAALVASARRRGVEFRLHTPVRSLRPARDHVAVQIDGEALHADTVVVAAGAWSPELLTPCGIKIPVKPMRGEMLAVRPCGWALRHVLAAGNRYLVPRESGEVLVGSTSAFVGFDKRVTAEGVAALRASAERMVPSEGTAELLRSWAGLRPCSALRRPIIARLPGCERILLATGHHRSGILLAPITAQLVTEMICDLPPSVALHPFGYRRH
jgi:glycine oxidase